jgi:RNA recognition motif-containing protein
VVAASVITDRVSGQSRGFGFVEMSTQDEAQAAIAKLDGQPFGGRRLTVAMANPPAVRTDRPRRDMIGGGPPGFRPRILRRACDRAWIAAPGLE